jgi:hypothetical protein
MFSPLVTETADKERVDRAVWAIVHVKSAIVNDTLSHNCIDGRKYENALMCGLEDTIVKRK